MSVNDMYLDSGDDYVYISHRNTLDFYAMMNARA